MGVWAIWDLPTAVANMFCKSIFSIQTCGPLMRWWNHLSSSLMGSSAMGTHIASAWRKFGAIGSSKRTGWVWPSFGAEKNIRLLLKLCWTWDLLPTLQEWLNLIFFSNANSYVMSAKLTKRPTCDEPYRLKGIRLMNSGVIASNQEIFVSWPELYFVFIRVNEAFICLYLRFKSYTY